MVPGGTQKLSKPVVKSSRSLSPTTKPVSVNSGPIKTSRHTAAWSSVDPLEQNHNVPTIFSGSSGSGWVVASRSPARPLAGNGAGAIPSPTCQAERRTASVRGVLIGTSRGSNCTCAELCEWKTPPRPLRLPPSMPAWLPSPKTPVPLPDVPATPLPLSLFPKTPLPSLLSPRVPSPRPLIPKTPVPDPPLLGVGIVSCQVVIG